MTIRTFQFLAIVLTALALIPSGAHLAALPNKIDLPREQYFTVQAIYLGWAMLGVIWPVALLADATLAYLVRSQPAPFGFAIAASLCFAVMLAVFAAWTLPANQATANWTISPENWEALRRQWEYSHAANALLVFAALCLAALSVVTTRTAP